LKLRHTIVKKTPFVKDGRFWAADFATKSVGSTAGGDRGLTKLPLATAEKLEKILL